MKKAFLFGWICILLSSATLAQKKPLVTMQELKVLVGTWQGTLNYSGTLIRKPHTTNAALEVRQIGKLNALCFVHKYDSNAYNNVIDTIALSPKGGMLRSALIKFKRKAKNGDLIVTTEKKGFDHDNNTRVTIREIYIIGKKHYTYKKLVGLPADGTWLNREVFEYVRNSI